MAKDFPSSSSRHSRQENLVRKETIQVLHKKITERVEKNPKKAAVILEQWIYAAGHTARIPSTSKSKKKAV